MDDVWKSILLFMIPGQCFAKSSKQSSQQQMLDENDESISSERMSLKVAISSMETGSDASVAPGGRWVESIPGLVMLRILDASVWMEILIGAVWYGRSTEFGPEVESVEFPSSVDVSIRGWRALEMRAGKSGRFQLGRRGSVDLPRISGRSNCFSFAQYTAISFHVSGDRARVGAHLVNSMLVAIVNRIDVASHLWRIRSLNRMGFRKSYSSREVSRRRTASSGFAIAESTFSATLSINLLPQKGSLVS